LPFFFAAAQPQTTTLQALDRRNLSHALQKMKSFACLVSHRIKTATLPGRRPVKAFGLWGVPNGRNPNNCEDKSLQASSHSHKQHYTGASGHWAADGWERL